MQCDRCDGIHSKGKIVCPCDCHDEKRGLDFIPRWGHNGEIMCRDCSNGQQYLF